ncbi:MAG TPA: glycosyltransferase family 39 protein [bacterium]|nr:glycosyltransferase family 39 protein [bacterium]
MKNLKIVDKILPAILFILFLVLYTSFKPDISIQHWDSICYGWEAETKGVEAIWGNHPLGHVILNSVYILVCHVFSYSGRALAVFQMLNSLFGSLTIVLLYLSLRRLFGFHSAAALGLSLLAGVGFSFWHYIMTGDIYIIAFLFALLTWMLMLKNFFENGGGGYPSIGTIFSTIKKFSNLLIQVHPNTLY